MNSSADLLRMHKHKDPQRPAILAMKEKKKQGV